MLDSFPEIDPNPTSGDLGLDMLHEVADGWMNALVNDCTCASTADADLESFKELRAYLDVFPQYKPVLADMLLSRIEQSIRAAQELNFRLDRDEQLEQGWEQAEPGDPHCVECGGPVFPGARTCSRCLSTRDEYLPEDEGLLEPDELFSGMDAGDWDEEEVY